MDKDTVRWLVFGAVVAVGVAAGAAVAWRLQQDRRLDQNELGPDRAIGRRDVIRDNPPGAAGVLQRDCGRLSSQARPAGVGISS